MEAKQIREAVYLLIGAGFVAFGAAFAVYLGVRAENPALWAAAAAHTYPFFGATGTLVLLLTSFFLMLALWSAKNNIEGERERAITQYINLAFMFGASYIIAKYLEVTRFEANGLLPGQYFSDQLLGVANGHLFVAAHVFVTAVHALFVLGLLALILKVRKDLDALRRDGDLLPLETTGYYAHFVTIVSLFMLPILYLSR
ncbi:hypothetical protein KKF91_00945 [Myxococcota bacterium]|nr:hypothetical protein [Myxococcota bacterium]MBU1429101.1 hypothetical protein [Myxococcota bacterium]MBU1899749.1 hypothetical protein [Myxococcota bacterium]